MGAGDVESTRKERVHGDGYLVRRGDWITIARHDRPRDCGQAPSSTRVGEDFHQLMSSPTIRTMRVPRMRTPDDAGIVAALARKDSLCRTEHMFFEGDRIDSCGDDPRSMDYKSGTRDRTS